MRVQQVSNNTTMKIKSLMLMSVMLFITTDMAAQLSMDKQRNRIDYVEESHLLRKGNIVTVLNVNFEWPIRLSNYPTTALHAILSQMFFGKNCNNLEEGMADYLEGLGKEIRQMPNDTGLEKRYVNLKLLAMAWEKDKYISMLASRTYRKGDQAAPDSVFNQLLTYDIVADNVLRMEDIIKKFLLTNKKTRSHLIQTFLEYSPQLEIGINKVVDYFDALPNEACLMPLGVLFATQRKKDTEGIYAFSLVPNDVMSPFMKATAMNTLMGKNKRRKVPSPMSIPMANDSTPKDSMFIYDYTATMPEYNGKTRDMMAYIHRQIKYPAYEKMQGIQGKVVVSFVVERDGSLTSPSVISPVSPGIDRQAVAAVMAMPKWKPGKNNDDPVRVRMKIPITFKLQHEEVADNHSD